MNPRTGGVGRCTASERRCPVGGPHFRTEREAQRYGEELMARANAAASSPRASLRKSSVTASAAPSVPAAPAVPAPARGASPSDPSDGSSSLEGLAAERRVGFLQRIRAARAGRRAGAPAAPDAHGVVIDSPSALCRYALDVMDGYDREFLVRTGDWKREDLESYAPELVHQLALGYEPRYRELDLQTSRAALVYGAEDRWSDERVTDEDRARFGQLMRLAVVTRASVPAAVWLRLNDRWNDKWSDPEENSEQIARDIARVGIEARVNGLAKRYGRGRFDHPFDSILGEAQRGSRAVLSAAQREADPLVPDSPVARDIAGELVGLRRVDLEDRFPLTVPEGTDPDMMGVTRAAYDTILNKLDESRVRMDWNRFSDQVLMLRRIAGVTDEDDCSPLDLKDDYSCLAYAAAVAGGSVKPSASAVPSLLDWQDREDGRAEATRAVLGDAGDDGAGDRVVLGFGDDSGSLLPVGVTDPMDDEPFDGPVGPWSFDGPGGHGVDADSAFPDVAAGDDPLMRVEAMLDRGAGREVLRRHGAASRHADTDGWWYSDEPLSEPEEPVIDHPYRPIRFTGKRQAERIRAIPGLAMKYLRLGENGLTGGSTSGMTRRRTDQGR
ncbi:hypothetical protein EMO89_00190 [Bifidobacterium tissieri]|uniref:Uncharacterized protein n=1 Tax=Bifidobacterium tissieri TaxID=1630162 RepID=A0A5M9ZXJ3_9BIFI|nr:hypothetical protein [Bifidobacterium tissieri]KAA8831983.1 hypothetical protein EMO89_00190 [Bifidobacterium tissieri]